MSNILKALDAKPKVLDFVPPQFNLGTSEQAKEYLEAKKSGNDFRMSDVIRIQTGVKEIEASDFEEMVELKTLERLKHVQESAYQEAYQLGLEDGKHEAFKKLSLEIKTKLDHFEELLTKISKLKTDLFQFNESHIVQLAFYMASRLAHAEIKANPDAVVDIMRQALEIAQVEEEVTVQIAPSQMEFFEKLKSETSREFEFLKKVKLVAVEEVSEGGCIIETNYGSIDARSEERVAKLWQALSENIYRVKDKVGAA